MARICKSVGVSRYKLGSFAARMSALRPNREKTLTLTSRIATCLRKRWGTFGSRSSPKWMRRLCKSSNVIWTATHWSASTSGLKSTSTSSSTPEPRSSSTQSLTTNRKSPAGRAKSHSLFLKSIVLTKWQSSRSASSLTSTSCATLSPKYLKTSLNQISRLMKKATSCTSWQMTKCWVFAS